MADSDKKIDVATPVVTPTVTPIVKTGFRKSGRGVQTAVIINDTVGATDSPTSPIPASTPIK